MFLRENEKWEEGERRRKKKAKFYINKTIEKKKKRVEKLKDFFLTANLFVYLCYANVHTLDREKFEEKYN